MQPKEEHAFYDEIFDNYRKKDSKKCFKWFKFFVGFFVMFLMLAIAVIVAIHFFGEEDPITTVEGSPTESDSTSTFTTVNSKTTAKVEDGWVDEGEVESCGDPFSSCRRDNCLLSFLHTTEICLVHCTDINNNRNDEDDSLSDTIQSLLDISDCPSAHITISQGTVSLQKDWLNLDRSVRSLEFTDTLVEVLTPGAFNTSAFSGLETLIFGEGTLAANLTKTVLEGLSNLFELNIIHPISLGLDGDFQGALESLFNLHVLKLMEVNHMKLQLEIIIGQYPALEELVLDGSRVEEIPTGVLQKMPNLQSLSLRNCSVSSIGRNAFNNLPKLVKIDLEVNNIRTVPTGVFDDIVKRTGAVVSLLGNSLTCLGALNYFRLWFSNLIGKSLLVDNKCL